MKRILSALVTAGILANSLNATADCGGSAIFSDLKLGFENFHPVLNRLGLTLIPDSKNGWILQDNDGAQIYFGANPSGSTAPCMRPNAKEKAYCGDQIAKLLDDDKKSMKLTDNKGNALAALEFTGGAHPSFIITPLKKDGSRFDKYLRLAPNLRNLDNTNYVAGLVIETYKDSKKISHIFAQRSLKVGDDGFTDQQRIDRCLHLKQPQGNLDVSEDILVLGNGFSEITDVLKTPQSAPAAAVGAEAVNSVSVDSGSSAAERD